MLSCCGDVPYLVLEHAFASVLRDQVQHLLGAGVCQQVTAQHFGVSISGEEKSHIPPQLFLYDR